MTNETVPSVASWRPAANDSKKLHLQTAEQFPVSSILLDKRQTTSDRHMALTLQATVRPPIFQHQPTCTRRRRSPHAEVVRSASSLAGMRCTANRSPCTAHLLFPVPAGVFGASVLHAASVHHKQSARVTETNTQQLISSWDITAPLAQTCYAVRLKSMLKMLMRWLKILLAEKRKIEESWEIEKKTKTKSEEDSTIKYNIKTTQQRPSLN